MINKSELETITRHFLAAALWADAPENTSPRLSRQAKAAARAFCEAFIQENHKMFLTAVQADDYGWHNGRRNPAAQFGHDLYLTQAGHGAGFWDRDGLAFTPAGDDDTLGNMLTKKCGPGTRFFAEVEFYRGWVYMYWPGMQNTEAAA